MPPVSPVSAPFPPHGKPPHSRRDFLNAGAIAAGGGILATSSQPARASQIGRMAPIPAKANGRRAITLPTELVAGEEVPTGRYKHPAAITEIANGDLLLAWYGGDGEYAPNTGVYGVRLSAKSLAVRGRTGWSKPVLLARDPFRSVGNPVVWQAPPTPKDKQQGLEGLVWLFYVVRFGDTWSESRIMAKVSGNGGLRWSDASLLTLDRGTMVRGKPIVLADGRYLLPVYQEFGADREFVTAETVSFCLLYDPATRQWTRGGNIESRLGNLQPAPAEIAPGHLIAFCRRGGGYDPRPDSWLVYAESNDAGATWSKGRELENLFPNPNAAVDLLTLRNGHLLLVYNHSKDDRAPLSLALSTDKGKTWKTGLDVATGPHDYAYPYAIQTKDDRIHLVYTSHGRTRVNRMVFREQDIEGAFPLELTLGQ